MNYCVPHDVQAFWYLNSCLYQLSSTPIVVWPGARSVKTTLIQTLVYQLSSTPIFVWPGARKVKTTLIQTLVYQLSSILIVVWPGARSCQNNSRTNSCLPTFINSHRCLTRSKESQNNFHTNSCRSTFINWHPCLTTSKDSRNTSHTKYTNSRLSTLINSHPCLNIKQQGESKQLSYKFASIPTLILIVRTRLLVACAKHISCEMRVCFFWEGKYFSSDGFAKEQKNIYANTLKLSKQDFIYIYIW